MAKIRIVFFNKPSGKFMTRDVIETTKSGDFIVKVGRNNITIPKGEVLVKTTKQ